MTEGVPNIAARVTALREARGWSQADLAYAAGVTRSYLSRLEGGEYREPSVWKLQLIAHALGLTVNDLIDDEPDTDHAAALRPMGRFGAATLRFLERVGEAFEAQQAVRADKPGPDPARRRHRRRDNGSELRQT
jgi:transcriptional regulator with XRE-family HTH domain